MSDKDLLQKKIDDGTICSDDLLFGRKMPFGKYKDKYMYWIVVKHPYYIKWIIKNTKFALTETERWLWKECLDELDMVRIDKLIYDLGKQVIKSGFLPESNPHYIVE